jgi:hypothetical protein
MWSSRAPMHSRYSIRDEAAHRSHDEVASKGPIPIWESANQCPLESGWKRAII